MPILWLLFGSDPLIHSLFRYRRSDYQKVVAEPKLKNALRGPWLGFFLPELSEAAPLPGLVNRFFTQRDVVITKTRLHIGHFPLASSCFVAQKTGHFDSC